MTRPPDKPAVADIRTEEPAQSLTRQAASGVAWGAGGALFYQVFALGVQTALTYILSKAEYGSYGKAFAALNLAMLLQQVGFNEILLRRRTRLRLWKGSVFWFSLTLGVLGALLLGSASIPLARLYDDPQLRTLLLLAAPMPVIRALIVLPTLELVDAMRFRIHYGLMLLNAVLSSAVTLALALLGFGAMSFLIATLVVEPFYVLVAWRCAASSVRERPRPSRWIPLARDLRFVFGSNAARYARYGVDPLILGLFAAPSVVGVYFFAQSMVNQIFRVITLNLGGVLLPALNRMPHDPVRQTSAFLRAARVLMLVGAPVCVGLGATGSLFVAAFLDADKWHDLPPVLGVLGLGMVFRLLDEPMQALIAAQGRFRLGFYLSLGSGALYLVICALGSLEGVALGTACAVAAFYVVTGPAVLTIAIHRGGGTLTEALKVFLVPFALAVCAIGPWLLLTGGLVAHGRGEHALVLLTVVVGSIITYLALGRAVCPPGWVELATRVHDIAPRRLKRLVAWIARSSLDPEPISAAPSMKDG